MLDFRKLDANMFLMSYKPVELLSLVDSACRHCRSFLARDVVLLYRVSPCSARIMADSRRVFQIISNGLSNAGKFTTRGVVIVNAVHVTAPYTPPSAPAGTPPSTRQYVALTISNTNSGKALIDVEALFVPFRGTFEGNAASAPGMGRAPVSHRDGRLIAPSYCVSR